jgi:glutamate/tyrosine decarboxylase-like PLP-dependent enzyme
LGFEGFRSIALNDLKNARLLSRALENSKYYTVLSDIHRFDPARSLGATVKAVVDENDVEVSPFRCAPFFLLNQACSHMSLDCRWSHSASLTK